MLTRHWYEHNVVGEALLLVAGAWKDPFRKRKLIFWTYELVLSEEEEYLWEILEKIAMKWGDSATISALASKDPLHFLHCLLALPSIQPYDPPPPSLPPSSEPCPIHPSTPEKPTTWTVEQRSRLWIAVQDAKKRGRSVRLLRLLGNLAPQIAAEYLGVAGTKKGIYHMLEMVGCPAPLTSTTVGWPAIPVGRVAARLCC